eukprot:scaffold48769_cov96-Cyclotella_meneghiniana.AAC.2
MLREECPFCNGLAPEDDEEVKEMRWYQRASELGCAEAHLNLGVAYEDGSRLGGMPDVISQPMKDRMVIKAIL